MNKECKKCKKFVDIYETFTGDICVDCYEIEYERMTEQEKIPNFINTIK